MENSEVSNIGFQLQSLLNIPPIKKNEQSSSGSTDSVPKDSPIRHTTLWSSDDWSPPTPANTNSELGQGLRTNYGNRVWVNSGKSEFTGSRSLDNPVGALDRHRNGQVPEQYSQERTPNYPTRRVFNQSEFRRKQNIDSANNKAKIKIVNQIEGLLKLSTCPTNFQIIKDRLIDAALIEQDLLYFLDFDQTVIEAFRLQGIEPLFKRSVKFSKAKYYCSTCNYHMDLIYNVISHIINPRHQKVAKLASLEYDIQRIPNPAYEHQLNLHFLVVEVMKKFGIDDDEKNLRHAILGKLNAVLAPRNWNLDLFGSSVSGFGFKTSNVNFHLDLSKISEQDSAAVLSENPDSSATSVPVILELMEILESLSFVSDVAEDANSLAINFYDTEAERNCTISIIVNGTRNSGIQLAELFEEYDRLDCRVRPLVVAFRHWARVTQVDDRDAGSFHPIAYTVMVLKHLLDVSVIPYIIVPDDNVARRSFHKAADNPGIIWNSPNDQNLGMLWLSLLRKYSIEFPAKDFVVSLVRPVVRKTEDPKIWHRKLSIEDPVMPKSNLARSASNHLVCDYIIERIKIAFRYFGTPRMKQKALYDKVIPLSQVRGGRIYYYEKPKSAKAALRMQSDQEGGNTDQVDGNIHDKPTNGEYYLNHPPIRMVKLPDYNGDVKVHVIDLDLGIAHSLLKSSEYYFDFLTEIFQGGEGPPKHCRSCGENGHLRRDCPQEVVPSMLPIAFPDKDTLRTLNNAMIKIHEERALSETDFNDRKVILRDIYTYLLEAFPDIEMFLFGSTNNGFGLHGSDVDINIKFNNHPITKSDFKSDEVVQRIKKIASKLRSCGCFDELTPIPSAKVPIVKFKHTSTQLEGDISLSNALAIQNTKLLRLYCQIDKRVKIIGCFLKQLTKICDISDASKGTLSSYAYVLMIIHFLQQCSPPVLPVLQQLPLIGERPDHKIRMIDGWNAYFFDDIAELNNLEPKWNEFELNTETVSELFMKFLIYYTETFDFDENVITISQLEPLTRKEKRWFCPSLICIEDPFEKSHNLGAGLTKRMSVYIIRTLQHYRYVFSMPSGGNFPNIMDYEEYFLDKGLVSIVSGPPYDRTCKLCNRIGHFASTCTFGRPDGHSPDLDEIEDRELDIGNLDNDAVSFRDDNLGHPNMDIRQLNQGEVNSTNSRPEGDNQSTDDARQTPRDNNVDSSSEGGGARNREGGPLPPGIIRASPDQCFMMGHPHHPFMLPYPPAYFPPPPRFMFPGPIAPPGFGMVPMMDPRFRPMPPPPISPYNFYPIRPNLTPNPNGNPNF